MKRLNFTSLWWPALSGVLLALVTPYFGYWFFAPVALIPFGMYMESKPSRWKLVLATMIMSLPFGLLAVEPLFRLSGTWWAVGAKQEFVDMLLYPAGILALGLIVSTSYLLPVFIYRSARERFVAPSLLFGLLFAAVEFFRSAVLLAGYSWGVLGYALIDSLYLKHIAALVGVYGLSFISAAIGIWGGRYLVLLYREGWKLRHAFFAKEYVRDALGICVVFVLALSFGIVREFVGPPPFPQPMRVAVIGSAVRTAESVSEGSYRMYRKLFLDAIDARADIVAAPENVFPYFVIDEDARGLIARPEVYLENTAMLYEDFLAISRGASSVTFALPLHTNKAGKRYNSILLYRNGQIESVYHKRKPVPFTEYSPLGFRLPIFETISKGSAKQDFQLGDMRVGGYICSEIGITPLGVGATRLIFAPSNDSALLSGAIGPLQHQFARMRALEAGAYMLRSSKGGISSIINPYGEAIATMEGENGLLILDIK